MLRRATSRRVGFAYEYLFELSQKGEIMHTIICLDDDNGMLFHDRRQSQDVKLRADVLQRLGERIDEEEQYAVKEMHADRAQGEKVIPVLFEEMDGIWLHMQNSNHKKMKKQEMKVFSMYEGWDKEQKKRSSLVEKTMFAGMESSQIFHEKREALIEKKYNADEIQQRILFVSSNPCNPFSLPVFHEKKI